MTKITLIEEQSLFRRALCTLINNYTNTCILNDWPSIDSMPKQNDSETPDLILISIYDFSNNGLARIQYLEERFPCASIIVISDELSYNDFSILLSSGIYGFFSTTASPTELEKLILTFDKYNVSHAVKLDSSTRHFLSNARISFQKEDLSFTKRELEVLILVCKEFTNIEISQKLGLSIRTIESFRRKMINKAGCKNMIGVILKAIQFEGIQLSY